MEIAQQSETRRDFAPIFIFALTLFLSASLMFVLQPMFGKVLLPLLGGAASVWNTCMVFYQSILFFGYLYAHVLSNFCSHSRQIMIHGALLIASLCFLPIGMPENSIPPAENDPTWWLLSMLLLSIGLPFFVLSTTSPLLQKWFSNIGHKTSHDPYYLSIASNAGSLLALLSYPFLLEPRIGLFNQRQFWSFGFFLLCSVILLCMIVYRQQDTNSRPETARKTALQDKPGMALKLHWLVLSFVPSSLLLGTTNYISIDIASVPLLWVIPLALYLISFIIVFSRYSGAVHKWMLYFQPWITAPLLIFYFSGRTMENYFLQLALHLLVFFIAIMVCHGELARKRPATRYLTQYYLIMSFGGMLGGIFNSFVAPLIFDSIYEYPLMIIMALLLNPTNDSRRLYLQKHWSKIVFAVYMIFFSVLLYVNADQYDEQFILLLIIAAIIANFFFFHKNLLYLLLYSLVIASCASPVAIPQKEHSLYQSRNFYGVLKVEKNVATRLKTRTVAMHTLYSGSTEHGSQVMTADDLQCTPIGYYSPQGPLGQLFEQYDKVNAHWQVGVVGLGAGEQLSYAKKTQNWKLFELNPAVVDIATNPDYFSYLTDCTDDNYAIEIGDARLTLEKEPAHHYDLLVIDAFSSDSIPTHLLTREAIALYFSKLKSDGLLVFHISNRHLQVSKVLADHAKDLALAALLQEYRPEQKTPLVHKSDWAVLAKNQQALQPLLANPAWQRMAGAGDMQAWTDDFTSIVSIWK